MILLGCDTMGGGQIGIYQSRTKTLRAHWLGSPAKRMSWDIVLAGLSTVPKDRICVKRAHAGLLTAVASNDKATRCCRATTDT